MFSSKIYGSWNSIQKTKYAQIFSRIDQGILKGRILDIGSGPGFLENFLQNKGDIIALDIENPRIKNSVIGSGIALPFADCAFDAIISIDAMHLIKGNDFARVLKDEGLVLLALFFNEENQSERKTVLKEKLNSFKIITEFELHGKENEYVVLGRKTAVQA
jgi:SAM-dependent methyltransferase